LSSVTEEATKREKKVNPLIKKPIFNSFIAPSISFFLHPKQERKANKRKKGFLLVHFNHNIWSPHSLVLPYFFLSLASYFDQQKKESNKKLENFPLIFYNLFQFDVFLDFNRVHHNLLLGLLGCQRVEENWTKKSIDFIDRRLLK
jgi:hypothetical protein